MTLTSAAADPVPAEPPPVEQPVVVRRRAGRVDLMVATGYLVGAGYVLLQLLLHPVTRIMQSGATEQLASEWWLRHGARVVSGAEPLFDSPRPAGSGTMNALTAHGFPGLSVPLGPVTLLIGPARTFALAVTLCLAGTAYAWYHVLSRHLARSRSTAVLAGALGGFAPVMVAHAQGDLARVAQFLVPFLVWRLVRLREPGRAVRNGLVLGLLVAGQALLDEELLFILALAGAVFLLAYAAFRAASRQPAGRETLAFLRGLGVAAAVTAALLAYPVSTQPHLYPRGPDHTGVDLFSFVAFPTASLATWPIGTLHHARLVTEQQTFYGWPLVLTLVVAVWWLRGPGPRALAVTAGLVTVLSLGREVMLKDEPTHIPGPWRWLDQLPLLRSVPAVDLALGVLPLVVLLFAAFADRGTAVVRAETDRFARIAWYALLAAVLLPIAPVPVSAVHFIGPAWRHGATAPTAAAARPTGTGPA